MISEPAHAPSYGFSTRHYIVAIGLIGLIVTAYIAFLLYSSAVAATTDKPNTVAATDHADDAAEATDDTDVLLLDDVAVDPLFQPIPASGG